MLDILLELFLYWHLLIMLLATMFIVPYIC